MRAAFTTSSLTGSVSQGVQLHDMPRPSPLRGQDGEHIDQRVAIVGIDAVRQAAVGRVAGLPGQHQQPGAGRNDGEMRIVA